MANLSFTTQGSTPATNSGTFGQGLSNIGSALGSGLSSAAQGFGKTFWPTTANNWQTPTAGTSPAANALNATPTTPVKKTTVNNVDGSSTSTEYHAPTTPTSSSGNTSSTGTVSGILPPAPTQPLAQATISPAAQNDPTYNPVTGSSAQNPIVGTGVPNSEFNSSTQPVINPNSQFVSTNPQNLPNGGNTTGTAPNTFSGILGSLTNAATNGSQATQNYDAQTASYGAGNIPIGQQAETLANNYANQIGTIDNYGAKLAGSLGQMGPAPVAIGNAQNAENTTTNQVNALTAQETAALQGTSQALTAQDQAATASNNAAGQSNTAQSTEQSGLSSAATAAAPTSNFPFSFNPLTGTFTNAATGAGLGSLTYNPTTDAATLAKEVINGTIPYSDAVTAMSYAPNNVGTGALQQAIVAGGGNIAQLEGQASGTATGAAATAAAPGQTAAQNTVTGGTAQTQAYNTVYTTATTNAANTATQQAQIRAVGQQALGLMQSDPAINKFTAQFGNQALNKLQTQLSNPQYAAFNTAIQSLQARIGAALQAGEIPTAATSNAEAIANGNISLNALGSTLSQVDTELSSFVNTQNSLADYAKSQMQSGSTGTSQSSSGGTVQTKYGAINTNW